MKQQTFNWGDRRWTVYGKVYPSRSKRLLVGLGAIILKPIPGDPIVYYYYDKFLKSKMGWFYR